ncbi:MAG: molybdopterin biosynthesis protein MoeB [Firmicutes bacterium GWF2_51_9]|nr:MAG: molybdopterin biosynthesis protein MoeB [Firmicutes bacterium GWF2_51_9]OGS57827.1 MAG: molybdopterin biosynthesis protein MoeB [Firmicutes bacterium GWE2_51_13]HAM63342.1 molybdopterin biosynthesis protein MoeB [Erysipelotrichaceae bacterium]HAO61295.1 molybdopterin biosynthesis protein MoeB [Erysipelotrichaceae bacterium]HBZ41393.1 molybdopterin biosynthesis protein MoeB [Erysipelotrichaceae bacterium]
MADRYDRNKSSINHEEQEKLKTFCVAVVGLGGLGGYIADQLARVGVGKLILIDGDVFDETNLNRQLFSNEKTIGHPKAEVVRDGIQAINPQVETKVIVQRLTTHNAPDLLDGADLVMDAVDTIPVRRLLQDICEVMDIPMVHGAISGWYGQVAFIQPKDRLFDFLYPSEAQRGIETYLGNPSFTPGVVASIQVAEAVKYMLGKGELLERKVLRIDLLTHDYEIIEIR